MSVEKLTRKDGATVYVVAGDAFSRLGQSSGAAAKAIKEHKPASVVLQLDASRQKFLDPDYIPMPPPFFGKVNSVAKDWFEEKQEFLVKLGLVPYEEFKAANSAAAAVSAKVILGDRNIDNTFDRIPAYKLFPFALGGLNLGAAFDNWRGAKDKDEAERAMYIWDNPVIRSKALAYQKADRDIPDLAKSVLGGGIYDTVFVDSAKNMIANINSAPGPVIVAVTPTYTHQREIKNLWAEGQSYGSNTLAELNSSAGFFDRYWWALGGVAVIGGGVAALLTKKRAPASAFHKIIAENAAKVRKVAAEEAAEAIPAAKA